MVIKFNNDLDVISNRFYSNNHIAGDDYHITFSGLFTAIVTINATVGSGYATYLYQGYGNGSSRSHLIELCKKEAIEKFIIVEDSTDPQLLILCPEYPSIVSVFMIQGILVSIL